MNVTQVAKNIKHLVKDNAYLLESVNALIAGEHVDKKCIRSSYDVCEPCQWLQEYSDELSHIYRKTNRSEVNLFHFDIMEEIEFLRYDIHDSYLKIFKLYLPVLNNSFFSKLLRLTKTISEQEKIDAKDQLDKMQCKVEELNTVLVGLERSIDQLSTA